MNQLQFTLEPPRATTVSPERRIDRTLEALRWEFEALTDQQRAELVCKPWWAAIDAVAHMRSMERAEEEVLGAPRGETASIYDRLVVPGEHAGEAILKVFRAMFGGEGA